MSKNSPGVCIRRGNELEFVSFIRGANKGKIALHYKNFTDSGAKIYFYEHHQPPKMEYSPSESWKAHDALRYAKWIMAHLPEEVDFVGIEGFSYGSKGNSAIDIVGYGYAVRMACIEKYGIEKFSVFSPGTVKKKAGKGNANKEKVLELFSAITQGDICNNQFWLAIKEGKIGPNSPRSDLVDAFFVQECALEMAEAAQAS